MALAEKPAWILAGRRCSGLFLFLFFAFFFSARGWLDLEGAYRFHMGGRKNERITQIQNAGQATGGCCKRNMNGLLHSKNLCFILGVSHDCLASFDPMPSSSQKNSIDQPPRKRRTPR